MRTITRPVDPNRALDVVAPRQLVGRVDVGALAVLAIDQGSKLLAQHVDHGVLGPAIEPGLNRDYSLGLVAASSAWLVVGTVVTLLAGASWVKAQVRAGRIPSWSVALVLGGAVSNVIDRVARGGVLDFIATPWIVLNLADLAVVAGLVAITACSVRTPVDTPIVIRIPIDPIDRRRGGDPHE